MKFEERPYCLSRDQLLKNVITFYFSFAFCLGLLLDIFIVKTIDLSSYMLKGAIEFLFVILGTIVQVKTMVNFECILEYLG
jgi:hypothetical protein